MKRIDLRGQKFGRLTPIEYWKCLDSKRSLWICKCDCGNTAKVDSYAMRNGNTQSCGCLRGRRFKDVKALRDTLKAIIEECERDGVSAIESLATVAELADNALNHPEKPNSREGVRG